MIIYLHGLASVGTGMKSDALIREFGSENVIAPDLPLDPDLVEDLVSKIIESVKSLPLVFVGTSLGGFWANYFAQKCDAPCVIVNPATSPSSIIKEFAGINLTNYTTGATIPVVKEFADKFAQREQFLLESTNGSLINLFLAKDDVILNYKSIIKDIPTYASCCIMPDGGHIFEQHWGKIVNKVKELVT